MIDPQKIKRILIVRNDRFGEFLLNIPAMRALKETFPQARLTAVVDKNVQELCDFIPYIDDSIAWSGKHSWSKNLRFAGSLRRKKMDLAVVLNPTKEIHILTFLAGIPVRVGYDRKLSFLLTHKMKDCKSLARKHEVEYNLELVGLIGAKTRDLTLALSDTLLSESDFFAAHGLRESSGYVALHPWTSDPVKQWEGECFRQLAKRISGQLGKKVLIIGGRDERALSKDIFGNAGAGIVDLTGMTSLGQLAIILKKCSLLISGDSGPVHLACAVKTPVIALFRNDMQGKGSLRWGPWGSGNIVIEKAKLEDISVDEVFERVGNLLK